MMMHCLSAVILSIVAIGNHQAEALFDAAICSAAEASTATASTCTDWLSINLELSNGDCCSGTTSTDVNQCNPLCTTVITGVVDNCFTEEQFGNFKVKSEACQILTIEKAMAKEGIACTDWQPILQGDARAFCIPGLGKILDSDTNCTDTCINMIDTVPDFCIGQAIGYWKDVPIRDFHESCRAKVLDRVMNKPDKTCTQWQALLELSIQSRIECGQYCQCTEEVSKNSHAVLMNFH